MYVETRVAAIRMVKMRINVSPLKKKGNEFKRHCRVRIYRIWKLIGYNRRREKSASKFVILNSRVKNDASNRIKEVREESWVGE